jgi:hypothetical protein
MSNPENGTQDYAAQIDNNLTVFAVLLGVTAAALDRPQCVGVPRMAWTEAMLRGIDSAKEGGCDAPILDVLRRALEIGSEPTPPESDGGSRIVDLVRKAA